MNPIKIFAATLFKNDSKEVKLEEQSIYDIKINNINGLPLNLNNFKGKHILFVNVASKCGFTPQYEDLQKLHEVYHEKLVIIGLPCNQFGGQEPGDAIDIKSFCRLNYGVTFIITEKIWVKGSQQHKLYTWLTKKINNGVKDSSVKWNFQKYLIDPNGELIDCFYSVTSPLSPKIINHIK